MDQYYALAPGVRLKILKGFERVVPELLGSSPYVTMVEVEPPTYSDHQHRILEANQTVFPFFLHPPGAARDHFGVDQLRRVFHWLNVDLRPILEQVQGGDATVLSTCFHLGQPVLLSPQADLAVLRVAMGAPLMRHLGLDPGLGDTVESRLDWVKTGLRALTRKLELIVDHFDTLASQENS